MEFITLIVEQLIGPVKKHLGFLVCSSNNVKDMHAKFDRLKVSAKEMEREKVEHRGNSQVVPGLVPVWLTDFEKINEEVGRITIGGDACFNLKKRYQAGKKASYIITRIDDLQKQQSDIKWTEKQIPPASMHSTSEPVPAHADDTQNIIFNSRKSIFENVLKALDPNSDTQKMALCGLGGIGKTTMMGELKTTVERKQMFDHVVMAVIGEQTDMSRVQRDIADFIGLPLCETAEVVRKDRLKHKFLEMSENGTKKILIILDDVWKMVDLEIIGLVRPLPSGFKLLLTSRDEMVCTQMDVETKSIFRMVGLANEEAKRLFWETARVSSNENYFDDEYLKLGEAILELCGGLPMAIKTIASSLKGVKKHAWKAALRRLKRHDLEDLKEIMRRIFEISYDNLKRDDKEIFVLSGLFPDDFNIPVEDLTRYGWGLKLFYRASSLAEARERTKASVDSLKRANLLTESYYAQCVKMHDLARAFVLNDISKFKQASIIKQDDSSEWPMEDTTRECCERILLDCTGMSKFPHDFNYPNLVMLKLMTDRKEVNLKFPEDFYQRMEKLQVISFVKLDYPLLQPVSLQYSTSLRTLSLNWCSLPVDISFLGHLINLEVLSFAYCSIEKLPSTIEKLNKLKLLDLTGCDELCVNVGVFLKLDDLEELYMGIFGDKAIMFAQDSFNEAEILLQKLSALDVEFCGNNLQPKNVSFKELERFRISVGLLLAKNSYKKDSYKNTLKLVTNSRELLDCKVNVLFVKTEELELSVKDLNHLGEILPSPSRHSFCKLKVLRVSYCEDLKCLFTTTVANGMSELENLTVFSCPVLKSLIHIENGDVKEIRFPKLKTLTLENLPDLVSLCECVMNVMDLPQLTDLVLDDLPNITSIFPGNNNMASTQLFLSKKALIPKLEILEIRRMEKLKEIWLSSSDRDEEVGYSISMLREIRVEECDGLVDMFPSNPMGLLSQLEELKVENCGSIEVLFNIDLGKTQQLSNKSSLRSINLYHLKKLREVWRIKDAENNSPSLPIPAFQAVESIYINYCEKFRNLFTPTTVHFDLGALKQIYIFCCGEEGSWENNVELVEKNSQEQEINVEIEEEVEMSSKVGDNRKSSHVAFSSHQLTHTFHQLRIIYFNNFKGMAVVFEIDRESSRSINKELLLLPSLEELSLSFMETLTHVWKWNWNEFLILHMKHQPQSSSSFQNLTTIKLFSCKSIKYLFSPLMAKLLSNLKTIDIQKCNGMEEVVSSRDDDDAHEDLHVQMKITPLFPHLQTLDLWSLPNLKHIGGAGVVGRGSTTSIGDNDSKFSSTGVVSWSLYQYARKISIHGCPSMVELSGTTKMNDSGYDSCTNVNQGSTDHDTTLVIPRPKDITMHKLSNLKILEIYECDRLEFIFPFSALECLCQLEKLTVKECEAMKVIVKEENGEQISGSNKVVVFPRLESIKLEGLPNLAGFFLGNNDFEWPLLNFVSIKDCSQIKVVTYGESRAPQLNYIYTELGKHECDFNFHLPLTSTLHQTPSSSLEIESSSPAISQKIPWSFQSLIELNMKRDYSHKAAVPSKALLELQKLEKIHLTRCSMIEVFEVGLEMANDGFNESKTVVKFPKLRKVYLDDLDDLEYIWKSNRWITLEFPNLTTLSISRCNTLKHVLTCSMVSSLVQLQKLHITKCQNIEAIVKEEEECDAKVSHEIIELPCLKSLQLKDLPSLKGFCLANNDFVLPSLTTLVIKECPELKIFTKGHLAVPELKSAETGVGLINVVEDINSFIIKYKQEGLTFGESDDYDLDHDSEYESESESEYESESESESE